MALNKDLAERIRAVLAGTGSLREVRMFGGLCFMLNGNMVAGTSKRGLLVRVGRGQHARALAPPRDERTLQEWLDLAAAFVNTLPPKPPRSKPPAPSMKSE